MFSLGEWFLTRFNPPLNNRKHKNELIELWQKP
jgi:hypothetical protein